MFSNYKTELEIYIEANKLQKPFTDLKETNFFKIFVFLQGQQDVLREFLKM